MTQQNKGFRDLAQGTDIACANLGLLIVSALIVGIKTERATMVGFFWEFTHLEQSQCLSRAGTMANLDQSRSRSYTHPGGVRMACWCAFVLPKSADFATPALLEDRNTQARLRRTRLKASPADTAAARPAWHSRDRLPTEGRGRARAGRALRGGSRPGLSALSLVETVPMGSYSDGRATLEVR